MSIFFDSKIVIPDSTNYGLGKRIFLDINWHKHHPLLAISHSDEKHGAVISVYDHSTEETVNVDSNQQHGVQITSLSWHPINKILGLGYETGEVVMWNHEEGEAFEGSRGHNSSIMLMEWSYDGTIVITSDNMGILVIWKSDLQGHLQTQAIHDFKDPVCHIVFRQKINVAEKMRDEEAERALGMMTSWRPKTGRNRGDRAGRSNNIVGDEPTNEKCFFIGVLSGTIYYLKEGGSSEEILSSGSSIRSLLYYLPKDLLIVLTEAQIMGQFHVNVAGDLKEVNKMKLSGHGEMRLFWVGTNTLAVVGRDPYVRLWDVESSSNTVLEPRPNEVSDDETFLSVDYHTKDGVLCCCTNKGKLVMWKETESAFSEEGECRQTQDTHWEAQGVTSVPSSSKSAAWCCSVSGLLAVNTLQDIILLREQELCFHFSHQVSIVQTQPNLLSVQMLGPRKTFDIKVDMQIKGITASDAHLCIWNGLKVVTYEFGPQLTNNYKYMGSFATKADAILIQEMSMYMQEIGQIQVRTFQGTIKQTLPFTGTEGPPITMAIGGDYFTAGSEYGFIKIWHIGRREAKLHTSPKNLNDHVEKLGEIVCANTNCNGTKVGFAIAKTNLVPDSRFFVMDLPTNVTQEINFPSRFIEKFNWEQEDPSYVAVEVRMLSKELQAIVETESYEQLRRDEERANSKDKTKSSFKYIRQCGDVRRPWKFNFSQDEAQATLEKKNSKKSLQDQLLENGRQQMDFELPYDVDHAIVTMFADINKGFLIHETRTELNGKFLVGLAVPYIYLAENGAWKTKKPTLKDMNFKDSDKKHTSLTSSLATLKIRIEKQAISEFDGVEDENKEGKIALMKYVYHTLITDIDGALRAIRFIKNEKIYQNMVRNCVKTRRMDVALLCLAKLKEARIAREVRLAMETEPEVETHVATLAVQLGMMEEAEELYKECKRHDLMLELFISAEWWEKAVKLCENHRRIQLRSTYHAYGKSLEYEKKLPDAIEMYEKAETHRYEVPRMLVDDPDQLQAYVLKKKDKDLYHWWAQYLESSGDLESALRYYELSHDYLSLVRLLCFLGNYEKAVMMAEKSGDKASAYHLARTMEDKGEVKRAISFFSGAGAYGNAIRMCMTHNMMDELWTMALKAEPSEQAEAAKYFETYDPPSYDRAIQLYHKAGYESKALDLAFTSQEFSALQTIVRDIMNQPNLNTDPLLLQKCADFFVQNNEIDKALDMLCAAHKYPEAMELCVDNNFTITDEIAERLTAPKGIGLDEQTRVSLLEKMGECCTLQGSYHLAAKKFTQAGNKIQAIKSLIKSGDTQRIIFYANVSRHREIYMIAAHYLQTTDWRKDAKIIQTIVHYYTKAQAYDSLAVFYETVAESEIESSRDYKSALEEYRKAENSWKDLLSCGVRQYEDRLEAVQAKINYIQKFLNIKQNMSLDTDTAMNDLKKLIEDPRSESGVRIGDIYGLIVEHYVNQAEGDQALTVLEEMKQFIPNKNLNRFLSPETIHKMEQAFGAEKIRIKSGGNHKAPAQASQVYSELPQKRNSLTSTDVFLPFLNKDVNDVRNNFSNGNDEGHEVEELSDGDGDDDEDIVDDEDEEVEDLDVEDEEIVEEEDESEEDENLEENAKLFGNPSSGFFSQTQQPQSYNFR